jgi:hypothetical protein
VGGHGRRRLPLNTRTGQWTLYNERNTPMNEIWVYGVSATPTKVYYAVWGSGLLEYTQKTGRWDKYDDPTAKRDRALQGSGLIHEIVTSVSYVDNIVWAATYFGGSRYDGRYWHNFLTKDSGLPSNFINTLKGVDANRAWFGTDKGLAYYDGVNWAVYRPSLKDGKPEMTVRDAQGNVTPVAVTTAPAHNYVLGIDFQGRRHLGRHRQGVEPRNSSTIKERSIIMNAFAEILETIAQTPAHTPIERRAITNHGVLNEAFHYAKPSSFSRGMTDRLERHRRADHLRHRLDRRERRQRPHRRFPRPIEAHLRQHHRPAGERRRTVEGHREDQLLSARHRPRLRCLQQDSHGVLQGAGA